MNIAAYTTVGEAVNDLERRGFTANFELIGKTFRAVESGRTFNPEDLTIVERHRFEGASDPEELAVVYAIEATDGTRGVLVDAYGTYANPDLSEFLKGVRVRER
ncbi:phosphoribosylpyrophosphate synthetase [Candidatus Nitrospira bockiana]